MAIKSNLESFFFHKINCLTIEGKQYFVILRMKMVTFANRCFASEVFSVLLHLSKNEFWAKVLVDFPRKDMAQRKPVLCQENCDSTKKGKWKNGVWKALLFKICNSDWSMQNEDLNEQLSPK